MNNFVLDRALHRKIKNFDRAQMEGFLRDVYEDARKTAMQKDEDSLEKQLADLRDRIGKVKGIGEARLNEIMSIIEQYCRDEENG